MASLAIGVAMTLGETERASAQQSPVTAIDIALEPDQMMIDNAKAANATLLKNFPKGFSLDETHHPHVSIFAGFVPTADLPKIYAAAGEVLAREKYTTWKLTASKYYYIPLGPIGLAGIVIEPTPDLLRLQQKLIDAAGPHAVKTATAAAFYTTPAEPDIRPSVIDYIAGFSDHVGKNFSPHVTIGVGLKAFLDAMLAAPFAAFTFFVNTHEGAITLNIGGDDGNEFSLERWRFHGQLTIPQWPRRSGLPRTVAIEPFARAPRTGQLLVDVILDACLQCARPLLIFWDQTRYRRLDERSLLIVQEQIRRGWR